MRERRSVDLGIDGRRTNQPRCQALPSVTLARYLTRSLPKADVVTVDAHLHSCVECWSELDSVYKILDRYW